MSAEKTTKQEQPKSDSQIQTRQQKNIADKVLSKVELLEQTGGLLLPKDYSAANALKSAFLVLQEIKDKNDKYALEVCTETSVANALFEMVIKALNPMKKQVSFIVRGNKLYSDPSYFGNVALAKRVGGLEKIKAIPIYEGDIFEYDYVPETGQVKITNHKSKLENIDITKIKGAYAIYKLADGSIDVELMSMDQIRKAWDQGPMKGKSGAHINFTDQMACKTVINRACKLLINTSDDSHLYGEEIDPNKMDKIPNDANTIETSFEDVTHEQLEAEKETTQANGVKKETVQTEIAINENDKADF